MQEIDRKLHPNEPVIFYDKINPYYGITDNKAYGIFMFTDGPEAQKMRKKDNRYHYMDVAANVFPKDMLSEDILDEGFTRNWVIDNNG